MDVRAHFNFAAKYWDQTLAIGLKIPIWSWTLISHMPKFYKRDSSSPLKLLRFQILKLSDFHRALKLSSLHAFCSSQDFLSIFVFVFDQARQVLVSHSFLLRSSLFYSCILLIALSSSPLHLLVFNKSSWSKFKEVWFLYVCFLMIFLNCMDSQNCFARSLWVGTQFYSRPEFFENSQMLTQGVWILRKHFLEKNPTRIFPRKIAL